MDTIYIIVASDEVYNKIVQAIDVGNFEMASKFHYMYKSLIEKLKSTVNLRAGHILLDLYNRQVFMVPISLAEEFPKILEGYREVFGSKLAAGFGLDLKEAALACRKSKASGRIEFYDEKVEKASPSGAVNFDVEVPPALFDPLFPPQGQPNPEPAPDIAKRPPMAQEIQAEAKMLDAVAQTIGGAEIQQQMQQLQQQMQQQQQQQSQPRDLAEALHGEQIPGHAPESEKDAENGAEKKSKKSDKSDKDKDEDKDEDKEEGANDKLASILSTIKEAIPQLTTLADKNPEAYKQAMDVIKKVLHMARSRDKTEKAETSMTEELNAQIEELEKGRMGRYVHGHFGGPRRRLPVGSVIGRRKKVVVNGKEVWRSVSAGQVQDSKGQPISVKSSNYQAENPKEPK